MHPAGSTICFPARMAARAQIRLQWSCNRGEEFKDCDIFMVLVIIT